VAGDGTVNTAEPLHFGIRPEAMPEWRALFSAIEREPYYPCLYNPYFYTDYDGMGFESRKGNGPGLSALTEDDCEALCFGCPLIKQCYDFAVANDEKHGIWGGIDFSRKPDTLF
jgi:hypothetical protein